MVCWCSHILLIVAVLSCPLVCMQGSCGGAEQDVAGVINCCRHCARSGCPDGQKAGDATQTPTKPSAPPCGGRQCICDGAILADPIEIADTSPTGSLAHVAFALVANLTTSGWDRDQPCHLEPDDACFLSGKDLRCLHSSFLC